MLCVILILAMLYGVSWLIMKFVDWLDDKF